MTPILTVFLGNPGKEYSQTRHNYPWQLLSAMDLGGWQEKFKGIYTLGAVNEAKVIYLKPQVFMNLSGESVQAASGFFKIPPQRVLVVHDDLEQSLGMFKFQKSGELGGHNGLRSISTHLGTQDFWRLRLGIGRPVRGDVSSFVLGRFTPDEEITRDQVIEGVKKQWEDLIKKLG